MTAALDQRTRAILARASTPAIANILLARGLRRTMMRDVAPLSANQLPMVGEAYTLRFIPSREDLDSMASYARPENLHRRAIEECPESGVLVIDAQGSAAASSMGDLMALRLHSRGAAGVVTDGGFRDTTGIRATGLPAFQRANAGPATPVAFHAVALDEPIGCGGVAVYPGDVIVGDTEGVVVIPCHLAAAVAAAAADAEDYEVFASAEIRRGASILDVLPPTPATRERYEQWSAAGRPELE